MKCKTRSRTLIHPYLPERPVRLRRRRLGPPRRTERHSPLLGVTGASSQYGDVGCVFGMQQCEIKEAPTPPLTLTEQPSKSGRVKRHLVVYEKKKNI